MKRQFLRTLALLMSTTIVAVTGITANAQSHITRKPQNPKKIPQQRQRKPQKAGSRSSEEQAARKYFLEFWNARFKKCGDTYYASYTGEGFLFKRNSIVAFKTDPGQWNVEPVDLSPADKANGIRWYCDLTVVTSISSYYDPETRQWSPFYDGTGGFWAQSIFLRGRDVPIIFQICNYPNGTQGVFYSNWYFNNHMTNGDFQFLKQSFDTGLKPIESCGSLRPRN